MRSRGKPALETPSACGVRSCAPMATPRGRCGGRPDQEAASTVGAVAWLDPAVGGDLSLVTTTDRSGPRLEFTRNTWAPTRATLAKWASGAVPRRAAWNEVASPISLIT